MTYRIYILQQTMSNDSKNNIGVSPYMFRGPDTHPLQQAIGWKWPFKAYSYDPSHLSST